MSGNTWIKLSMLKPGCAADALVGTTEFRNERDWLYPERVMKLGASIIWVPKAKAHVCVASYVDAFRNGDKAAIGRLTELGIPPGINFGYGPSDDLSAMYTVEDAERPKRGRKPGSGPVTKVMRAEYAAEFEDGTKFSRGDVVKILFRKKFVEDLGGAKRFRNAYERPTAEELKAFLEGEARA